MNSNIRSQPGTAHPIGLDAGNRSFLELSSLRTEVVSFVIIFFLT